MLVPNAACKLTGLATSAVTLGKVTALDHELLDNTVESRTLVAESLLTSSQSAEVLSRLRDSLSVQTKDNSAQWLVTLFNVEIDLVSDLGTLGSFSCLGEEDEGYSEDK